MLFLLQVQVQVQLFLIKISGKVTLTYVHKQVTRYNRCGTVNVQQVTTVNI